LKTARGKHQVTYKSKLIRAMADVSAYRPGEHRLMKFKLQDKNNCQPRLIHLEMLSFKTEGEMKTFHNKHTL
jgi:hypothetical protein